MFDRSDLTCSMALVMFSTLRLLASCSHCAIWDCKHTHTHTVILSKFSLGGNLRNPIDFREWFIFERKIVRTNDDSNSITSESFEFKM